MKTSNMPEGIKTKKNKRRKSLIKTTPMSESAQVGLKGAGASI